MIRDQVAEEMSSVATKSLEDDKVVWKASELSKDIVHGMLNDKETKLHAAEFIKDVLMSEESNAAALNTLKMVLNDPVLLQLLNNRIKEILIKILLHDDTKDVIIGQIQEILRDDAVKNGLRNLIEEVSQTEEVKNTFAEFFKSVLDTNQVRTQGKVLAQEITQNVLSDADVRDTAGEALWSITKKTFIPNYFYKKDK